MPGGSAGRAAAAVPAKLVGVLYSFTGDTNGVIWPVRYGKTIIGAESGCDVELPYHQVSRQHCQVIARPGQGEAHIVRLMDLGSTNGTILNDVDIQHQPDVGHGDRIRVGPIELVFMAVPPPRSDG